MVYNHPMKKSNVKLNLARGLIGVVTFLNLQAAFQFMLAPENYSPGFEVSGAPGNAMIQGMGLLFLMWNIPYVAALIHPQKHFLSMIEAVTMQAIGVFGETILLFTIQGEHPMIHASVVRFIIFDGGGLVLLLAALMLVLALRREAMAASTE